MKRLLLILVCASAVFAQAPQVPDTTTVKDTRTAVNTALTSLYNARNYDTVASVTTSPYSVAAGVTYISCDATSGAITINLPAATGTGREITVKKTDSTANACTPTRAGSDTIDGATSYSLTSQYASSKLVDAASATWHRSHVNQLGGDVSGISTGATVVKVNGKDLIKSLACAVGDPAGSALSTGVLCYVVAPTACTIAAWDILIDTAATVTVKTWKVATGTAIPTSGNSISTSGVSISSGTAVHSTTVSDFTTTTVSANDIVAFNLESGTPKYIYFGLQCKQ